MRSIGPVLPAAESDSRQLRNWQLDLLRCVAVFLVLGRHMSPCPSEASPGLAWLTETWKRGGWVGVDLFFVLSGFLVSGLLFREFQTHGLICPWRFLVRRGLKIYPAFWVLLITTLSVLLVTGQTILPRRLAGEVLFLQNYLGGLWAHTWSLAVEEHFYLLLVFGSVLATRSGGGLAYHLRKLPWVFLAVATGSLMLRTLIDLWLPYSHRTHLFGTHIRLDALLFGVLLSYSRNVQPLGWVELARRNPLASGICGVAMLSLPFVVPLEQSRFLQSVGLTMNYLASGLLLIALLEMSLPNWFIVRMLAAIGMCSYSVYLWHLPVHQWLARPLAVGGPSSLLVWGVYAAVYLVGSVVMGLAMSRLVEWPLLKFRDRWYPSRSRPAGDVEIGQPDRPVPEPDLTPVPEQVLVPERL